ncbi:Receptor-like protein kinase HAIKU2 [Forsythia ovata]|uniref:Receptor-like protein kinase HAIKU2 n=1 Tax=Forsythia ovata TaxID=205694 RepID=A0ABD1U9B9_9LAMI
MEETEGIFLDNHKPKWGVGRNYEPIKDSDPRPPSDPIFLNHPVSLQLFENEFIGEFPAELGEFKKLVNLSLYTNKLTGQLPKKLGLWADFDYIDVFENYLKVRYHRKCARDGP